jgi:predicted ester cyclase
MTSTGTPRGPAARSAHERLLAAVNAHDADAVAALCSEHVVWEDPAAPGELRGREAVRRFHAEVMFRALPDVHVELLEGPYLSIDGTRAAARLRISGTMTGPLRPPGFGPTGARVEFETAEFSRFDGELLAHHHVVLDMLELARQIAAAPRAGSAFDRANVGLQRLLAWGSRRRIAARRRADE